MTDRQGPDTDRFREAKRLAAEIRRAPSSQRGELFTGLAKLTRVTERSTVSLDRDVLNVLLVAIDEHRLIEGVLHSKAWSHSPEDQRDLGQEIRLKLVNYLLTWKAETSLVGLLRIMAGSLSHDRARTSSRHPVEFRAEPPEPAISTRRISSTVAEQERIRLVLLKLPPRYRNAFTLHVLEGHTVAETAKQLGLGEGATRRNIITARKYLGRLW